MVDKHVVSNIKKFLVKFKIGFLKKYSIQIYVIILIFSVLFYLLLMGAAGHGFHFNTTDKIALTFVLFGISIVPNYKRKSKKQNKKATQILSLIISIGTIIIGIGILVNLLGFKFGSDINLITIGLFYIIPLIFVIINGVIINAIATELRK